MKAQEFRGISTEELVQKEKILKKELFELNQQLRLGTVEKPSRFRSIKRDIARIFTVIRERELEKK